VDKARACAGDLALGAEVIAMLRPFVFPRLVAPTVLDEVRDLSRRIKRELVGRGAPARSAASISRTVTAHPRHRVLRPGAPADPRGQAHPAALRGTLAALDALLFAGLIHDDEHAALSRSYRWLRHAEHVLQLEAGSRPRPSPRRHRALRSCAASAIRATTRSRPSSPRTPRPSRRLFATLGEPTNERADVIAILRGELTEEAETAPVTARVRRCHRSGAPSSPRPPQ